MTRFKEVPFSGDWVKIDSGGVTFDSVVGMIDSGCVVKWSRNKKVLSPEEVHSICLFSDRSLSLYREILGEEFIVPSLFVVGQKKDHQKRVIKPFIFQPYIDSWTGKSVPEEIRGSQIILSQWFTLCSRLYKLYITADDVNGNYPVKSPYRFPITLTLGTTRQNARYGSGDPCNFHLPKSPNILIRKEDLSLMLCDFGAYTPWTEQMTGSYQEIIRRSKMT